MTQIQPDWLQLASTRKILNLFESTGHEIHFVGGCVRNALLGTGVTDFDLATNAHPTDVLEIAKAAGVKAIPTGIDHGTVTLVENSVPFEITTYRNDVSTDGRRAVVSFSTDISEDAKRRDFTMNALYLAPDGQLLDPIGGLDDLNARTVRFIGDPVKRIKEDYLRILRFFRFYAWYADIEAGIEPEGLAACAENLDGLLGLSKERVTAEMLKLLSAKDPAPALASMKSCGALNFILPGAESAQMSLLVHNEEIARLSPNPITRLAALGAPDEVQHLRLSKKQLKAYQIFDDLQLSAANAGHKFGKFASDYLVLQATMLGQEIDPNRLKTVGFAAEQHFPITASDLIANYQGPALGLKLRELENRWIDSNFSLSKDELLD